MGGVTRWKAAEAVQQLVGGDIKHIARPRCYDLVEVRARDGRIWKLQADSSLSDFDFSKRIELITPILTYDDVPLLQEICRALRKIGCKPSQNSGLHVHVSSEPHTPKTIRHLVKNFNRLQELLFKAVGVQQHRLEKYCKPSPEVFVEKLNAMRNISDRGLNRAYFGKHTPKPEHYNPLRYRALNLSNLWSIKTVEYRFGEIWPNIHAGKIRAFIILCLALSAHSLNARASKMAPKKHNGNLKYAMRICLLNLGIVGPEYKNVRKHLVDNMPGNCAWK